jgi:D-alanine-D-alanine ligase
MGEDGTIQGLMRLAELPFAGPGVLGSAAAMDKDIAKKLFESAGLPVARSLVVHGDVSAEEVFSALGQPVFVKPANLGSSVGIHKAHSEDELYSALQDAFRYDSKVLIEEFITGRELECSVLGNESPIASVPGEIIPQRDFYSYEAKYLDENGALLEVPAQIDTLVSNQLRKLAVQAFQVLSCEGMARVDFFLNEKRGLVINEVNTIPGFTRISMYPRLWQASGVSYPDLIDRLIQLALERASRESGLSTSYST